MDRFFSEICRLNILNNNENRLVAIFNEFKGDPESCLKRLRTNQPLLDNHFVYSMLQKYCFKQTDVSIYMQELKEIHRNTGRILAIGGFNEDIFCLELTPEEKESILQLKTQVLVRFAIEENNILIFPVWPYNTLLHYNENSVYMENKQVEVLPSILSNKAIIVVTAANKITDKKWKIIVYLKNL